ncbi:MAG: GIY-YIG nuclease family protein [Deltaproteobacteria bacterium]|nr:GIY-YIG nuclease family protein [Deltaproteobacteria bacterium]
MTSPGLQWFLYILECGDGSFYTGVTNDIERRVAQHNAGKASRYTRTHLPVKLVYSERCGTRARALVREREIKALPRRKKEALVGGNG